jgi:lipoprotein-anchoring transpeptidase ErfK/SrfK
MQQNGTFVRFQPDGLFPAAFHRCFPAIVVSGEDNEAIRASRQGLSRQMTGNELNRAALTRRRFLTVAALGATSTALSACVTSPPPVVPPEGFPSEGDQTALSGPAAMYAAVEDEGRHIPAVPYKKIDPQYYRQIVDDPTGERPGTIVVHTPTRFLYLVMENGQALRYGVGIGRQGFSWSGRAQVQWKQKWPKWTPPDDMIARQPELAKYSAANGGMAPGLDNPLGARALYLFQGNVDTLYRLHGSPEWWSIGKAVSSGCVRLINQDIIDLYSRVPTKTPVLVV